MTRTEILRKYFVIQGTILGVASDQKRIAEESLLELEMLAARQIGADRILDATSNQDDMEIFSLIDASSKGALKSVPYCCSMIRMTQDKMIRVCQDAVKKMDSIKKDEELKTYLASVILRLKKLFARIYEQMDGLPQECEEAKKRLQSAKE